MCQHLICLPVKLTHWCCISIDADRTTAHTLHLILPVTSLFPTWTEMRKMWLGISNLSWNCFPVCLGIRNESDCCADFFWSIFILFCFGYSPPACCFLFHVPPPPPPPRPTFDFITSDIPVYSCPRTKQCWGISREILSHLISSQHVLNSLQ